MTSRARADASRRIMPLPAAIRHWRGRRTCPTRLHRGSFLIGLDGQAVAVRSLFKSENVSRPKHLSGSPTVAPVARLRGGWSGWECSAAAVRGQPGARATSADPRAARSSRCSTRSKRALIASKRAVSRCSCRSKRSSKLIRWEQVPERGLARWLSPRLFPQLSRKPSR